MENDKLQVEPFGENNTNNLTFGTKQCFRKITSYY